MKRAASGIAAFLLCAMLGSAHAAGAAIKPFERQSLQAIVATHAGQEFWLVLWDLDCVYCMQSLKNLSAAQKKNPALRIVTVATDPIEEHVALAARLHRIGVRGEAYALGDAAPESLRFAIDPNWRGEKPRAYFYAADGVRTPVTGVLDAERILTGKN